MKNEIMASGKIFLGKVNRNGDRNPAHGAMACKAFVTWELRQTDKGPRFSAQAEAWNNRGTDIFMGGQCLEKLIPLFRGNTWANRILEIWRVWHLNNMNAGTPEQSAFLDSRKESRGPIDFYAWACAVLKDGGLYEVPHPDGSGRKYAYGSEWLYRPIPQEIVDELMAMQAEKVA